MQKPPKRFENGRAPVVISRWESYQLGSGDGAKKAGRKTGQGIGVRLRPASTGRGRSRGADNLRIIGTIIVLCALWLLLSGVYKPLVIGFGAASVLLSVYFAQRMNRADGYVMWLMVRPMRLVFYFIWLLGEIAKATWAVTRVIMAPEAKTRQHLFAVRQSQKSDLGQVIYANSITLTPGTITVETEPDRFIVHALCYGPSDVDDLRDMDRRVSGLESDGGKS